MNAPPSEACVAAVRAVMMVLTNTEGSDDLQARWDALEASRKLRSTARASTGASPTVNPWLNIDGYLIRCRRRGWQLR